MNVLDQLQAMGFREEPLRFDTGGGSFDGFSGAVDGAGGGPSGADAALAIADAVGQSGFGKTGYIGASPADVLSMVQEALQISPTEAAMMASQGKLSTGAGLTASELGLLQSAGLGRMDISPTQTVDQALASFTTHALAPYALAFMPGAGLARGLQTGAQLLADLSSGKVSPGSAVSELALSLASNITGLSKGALALAAKGDFGEAAATAAKGAITTAVAQVTGLPAGVVGLGVNALGSGITAGGGMSGGTGSTDVAGGNVAGPDVMADGGSGSPGGFDMSALGPAFTVAALEDMFAPKEAKEDKDKQNQFAVASPFGVMPYA